MDGAATAVAFGRLLRRVGLPVPTGAVADFAQALDLVGVEDRRRVHASARACFLRRPDDSAAFDRWFAAFFDGVPPPDRQEESTEILQVVVEEDAATGPDDANHTGDRPDVAVRWSATEILRHRDFAACTNAELDELHRLMLSGGIVGPLRRSRHPVSARRGAPDIRRTVKASLRESGEIRAIRHRAPGRRPRRVVLLLDVSGSMEPYSRALLRFAHAAVAGSRGEAFTIGTRLTRLTRALSTRDPDTALDLVSKEVDDWSGGTRLGDGLRLFNDRWGSRGIARGAVVVVLSDGWDRGDPEMLGAEMARLSRVAHRIIWVNPLKALPGYAPLARGMAAALPHVDRFVEGHDLASLERLAEVISG